MVQVKWCERCEQSLELDLCHCPPLGPACDCDGCTFCAGRVVDCTCHVDWDELAEQRHDGRNAQA